MAATDVAEVALLEQENFSPWSLNSLGQELAVQGALQYVAVAPNGQVIGWCACRLLPPEAELLKIAVTVQHQHDGIGSLLLQRLLQALQIRRVTSLFLEVRAKNLQAVKFYTKHGFIDVGSRPGYYTDPPDKALILRKSLSS